MINDILGIKKSQKIKVDDTLKNFALIGKGIKNNIDKMYVEGHSIYDLNLDD
jgi:hypothetical protein